jgi:hypothetical protein
MAILAFTDEENRIENNPFTFSNGSIYADLIMMAMKILKQY